MSQRSSGEPDDDSGDDIKSSNEDDEDDASKPCTCWECVYVIQRDAASHDDKYTKSVQPREEHPRWQPTPGPRKLQSCRCLQN